MRAQQRRRVLPRGDRRARVHGELAEHGRVEHEPRHLGRLLVEHLVDEVVGDLVAAHLERLRRARRIRGAAQRQRGHLQGRGPPLASLVQQGEVGVGQLDVEVRSRWRVSAREKYMSRSRISHSSASEPHPVQPQRRVKTAGEHQLGSLGWPALNQVGHVPRDRRRGDMEVVHDDRRALRAAWRHRWRVDAMTSGDIRRSDRQQVGGIGGRRPALMRVHGLDEPGPEPEQVGVGAVAGQPGGNARRPGRRPVREQYGLAGPRRPYDDGQPPIRACRQLVTQLWSGDQRVGQRRRAELRQRELRRSKGPAMTAAISPCRDAIHHTPVMRRTGDRSGSPCSPPLPSSASAPLPASPFAGDAGKRPKGEDAGASDYGRGGACSDRCLACGRCGRTGAPGWRGTSSPGWCSARCSCRRAWPMRSWRACRRSPGCTRRSCACSATRCSARRGSWCSARTRRSGR